MQRIVLYLLLGCTIPTIGQEPSRSLTAKYTEEFIQLDGILDEPVWQQAEAAGDFYQFFPNDTARAEYGSEVRIVYDATTLYVAVRAESPDDDYVVASLRRDFSGVANDNFTLLFDTFRDGTNAFAFGVTPYGVQREILVSQGGAVRSGFDASWDVRWQAESKIYEDHYTIEMAIPFTSLKYPDGATTWRFRPYRWNMQTNEQSSWVQLPQTQLLANLAFMGDLHFEQPLGKSRTPVALIPYVNALAQRDFDSPRADRNLTVGGDAKIAVGDGLNLDLTVNPDFSNVEVDAIFTNLTRFEVFLPERRQFFIDNSDLFNSFGNYFNEARPFFSRRIGLARNSAGDLIQNNILGGARLSGKLTDDWRIGVLNIQTAEDRDNGIASNNNAMFAVQRKVGVRSNVGAFLVNRQAFGENDLVSDDNRYNRVFGVDYNLASADNAWNGKAYIHKSLQPGEDDNNNLSAQATVTYNKNNWRVITDYVYVDQAFRADLGFVPRRDLIKTGQGVTRFFFPKNREVINRHSVGATFVSNWRPGLDFAFADNFLWLNYGMDFTNSATLALSARREHIHLFSPFDPTRTPGAEPLPGNADYKFNYLNAEYIGTPRGLFTYGLTTTVGQFFNGNRYSAGADLGYRFQPYASLALSVNYDGIRLPDPYTDADLWLVTPRLEVTFSRSLFWTTLVQFRSQSKNLGINSRLQWRFAPLSDLFLVYNDNYLTSDFSPRFRSINLKLTYWLNL